MTGASAQLQQVASKSPSVEDKLAQSYHAMYDLKFQDAFKAADEAKAVAQDDPLPYVAQAWVVFFRELDRLHILRSELFATDDNYNSRDAYAWDAGNKKLFDSSLDQAEKLAKIAWAATRMIPARCWRFHSSTACTATISASSPKKTSRPFPI